VSTHRANQQLVAPCAGELKLRCPSGWESGALAYPAIFTRFPLRAAWCSLRQKRRDHPHHKKAAGGQPLPPFLNNFDIPTVVARPASGTAEVSPDFTHLDEVSNLPKDLNLQLGNLRRIKRVKTIEFCARPSRPPTAPS